MKKLFVAVALAAFLASGCSTINDAKNIVDEADASAKALEKIKPCDLVTKADAEAAYGGKLLDPVETTAAETPACTFGTTDINSVQDNVQVMAMTTTLFDGTKLGTKIAGDSAKDFKIEEIKGLGEDAFYQTTAGDGDVPTSVLLAFKKNKVAIYVSVTKSGLTPEQTKAAQKQLAEKVVSKVPAA